MFAMMSSLHDSEEIKEISPKSTILSYSNPFKYSHKLGENRCDKDS